MNQQRRRRTRIRWAVIDLALGPFTASSVVPLLSAAIDSPFLGAVRSRLWLVWVRALRRPPTGIQAACLADLSDLVAAGLSADPRAPLYLGDPADPRLVVRYGCGGGVRLRIHPGELEHPLLFLRSVSLVAAAIDPYLVRRLGFGLDDVLELTLRASDRYLSYLSPAWPAGEPPADDEAEDIDVNRLLTDAEVSTTGQAQALDLNDLAESCSRPAQTARALQWLSRGRGELRMSVDPAGLSLGPVLAVVTDHGTVPVPAALMTWTLLAASTQLAAQAAKDRSSQRTLRAFTAYRTEELLRGPARITDESPWPGGFAPDDGQQVPASPAGDSWAGDFAVFVGPAFSGVITSYLARTECGPAIEKAQRAARAEVAEAARIAGVPLTGPALVVYGGLAGFAPAPTQDAVCLHVEELAEMRADAEGDLDLVAHFLHEVSSHPGVPELVFVDVLDVWWHWRDHKMIGPLFPPGAGVAVMPYETRPDWERAAALEPIEEVLARAGWPPCARWPTVRMDDPGQATLLAPAPGPPLATLVRADPPLLLMISLDDGAPLSVTADSMHGLADGIRITAGRHQDIADGWRLPAGQPFTCVITVTADPQPPQDDAEVTGISITTDLEHLRVGLQLGPEFVDRLADAPQGAHELIGWALHHAVAMLRGRSPEEAAVDRERFMAAWNATPPIMMIRRFHNLAPASVPLDPVPHGEFARGRAFRAITIELASTEQPNSPLTDRDVNAHLTAVMETLLRRRLSECAPAVIADVARTLNAAHAAEWRSRHELTFALSAPWAADWQAAALAGEDPVARLRPLELLLEFLVLTPPGGDHHPDRYELAELEEIARALLEQRTRLNAIDLGMNYAAPDADPWMRKMSSRSPLMLPRAWH